MTHPLSSTAAAKRCLPLILDVAAVVLLLTATVAQASGATVARFQETTAFSDQVTDECRGVQGTISGTNVLAYQQVVTLDSAGNPTGYHVTGTSTDTFRLDFVDGSYGIGESVTRPIANLPSHPGRAPTPKPTSTASPSTLPTDRRCCG
jgi:hypothetical protein